VLALVLDPAAQADREQTLLVELRDLDFGVDELDWPPGDTRTRGPLRGREEPELLKLTVSLMVMVCAPSWA
jgi:hypothetical protein